MKNIIIFGLNGQISSALIKKLALETSYNITVFSSKDVDFSNLEQLKYFLNNLNIAIDLIINCCAYTNVDKAEEETEICDKINHQAVKIIADFCNQKVIKFIHYSTDYVFDGKGDQPFEANNQDNLHPINYYGLSKLNGEKAILNSNCDYLIIRVSWVFDHNPQHRNFYNTIKKLALQKEELQIIDDQIGSPTSADFIAEKTILILKEIPKKPQFFTKKIIHLNNGVFMSWYDFAVKIINELQQSGVEVLVKKITRIKSLDYNSKAKRPLNSRLKNTIEI